ncbi:DNA polymerase I [hydrothermal vent metagenome]|uniref:DNA-directed DNA polymerase n=1 Tax=hydrothermal vent metagenome TaxID=652676 RepID=A0A3B0UX59_9ZZZZ
MSKNQLVLIDGHALAYRMFFALPLEAFTTKSGEPTNATYGFLRTVIEWILADMPPKYFAVSFDLGKTFRDELFADYKGTREKMPDELRLQIGRIKEVIQTLNIPILELEGFEADDVLGTIARQAKPLGVPVHIITGDRDLLQLVDENTRVELPTRGGKPPDVFDETAVINYFNVRPDQVVDWKALVGDSSDNIPGVRGVGAKTAAKLLNQYETLDEIYANVESIKGAMGKKVAAGKESAYLSQKLARIVTDAPITLDLEACIAHDFDPVPVIEIFRELEFRTLTNILRERLGDKAEMGEVEPQGEPTETIIVQTQAQLDDLVKKLNAASLIAFDVETTGLDKQTAELVGVCLAVSPPVAYYIPVGHLANETQSDKGQMSLFAGEPELAEGQLPLQTVLDALRPAFTNPKIGKVAHNAKYDFTILDRYGLRTAPISFDTMIAEWLTDPATKHKGLKDLSRHRLGIEMTEIKSLIGKGKTQKTFAEVPIEDAAPYGAADADMTLRLVPLLQKEIEEKELTRILDLEMPLIPVLSAMEQEGIGLDVPFFRQMSQELAVRLRQLEAKIHEIAGEPFNINSTQQMSDILFGKLGYPVEHLKKTRSGFYSTAASVLESLKATEQEKKTGMITAILEYRGLGKLKSTYVDALPELVNKQDGRIHTSFNQTGAITGRIASSNPNLQNIPIRSEVGQQIRRGFVARPGHIFLAADYSQVELRILAHVSQDEALLEAFHQNQDIHSTTAAAVYGIDLADVTYNQRRFAKAVNFGLIYGMGAFRLARDSELTLAEAENYIKDYFARFPGIQKYLDETKQHARENGYVETLLGRRRYFPVFNNRSSGGSNVQARLRAEREAINHPIQGTAADIVKIAMLRLHDKLKESYKAKMLLQVHDELLLELPEAELDDIRELVVETMSGAFSLDVSLKVDASTGRNWLELKD